MKDFPYKHYNGKLKYPQNTFWILGKSQHTAMAGIVILIISENFAQSETRLSSKRFAD